MKNGHFAKAIVRQNGLFWAELENAKEIQENALQTHYTCSMQETALKVQLTLNKIEKFLKGVKNGHFTNAIVRQNGPFWPKLENGKKIQENALETHYTHSMQERARNNS